MNKSMLTGVIAGAVAVTALGGVAGYKALNSGPEYADVLAVKPVTETTKTPKEICEDVVVNEQAPVKDPNRIAGTAVGAVAGGLLGNQVGGGSGKTIATVAGAAAGGYAGNQVQKNMQEKRRGQPDRTALPHRAGIEQPHHRLRRALSPGRGRRHGAHGAATRRTHSGEERQTATRRVGRALRLSCAAAAIASAWPPSRPAAPSAPAERCDRLRFRTTRDPADWARLRTPTRCRRHPAPANAPRRAPHRGSLSSPHWRQPKMLK